MLKRILVTRVVIVYLLVVGLLLYLKNSGMDYFATLDPGRPKIETGYGFINKNGFNVRFSVIIESFGDHHFSEYGVVYVISDESGDLTPTIDNNKFVFRSKPRLGKISDERDKQTLIIQPKMHVYYRAYILLDNGQAVYGEVRYLLS
ncbi:hypothetical protein [Dyadobacter bucti]|uniref:hypothetical protein n=1 Tax=Dyadobacter bucti TaxID=2572203 RepID=UPI003F70C317